MKSVFLNSPFYQQTKILMKKIIAIFATLFAFGAFLCFFYVESNKNSAQFVPPKGTVTIRSSTDFFGELENLCSANADSKENGFRDIVQCLGRAIFGDISDENWKILCEKLDVNPDEPPRYNYLSLNDFLCDVFEKAENITPQFDAAGKRIYNESAQKQVWKITGSLDKLEQNREIISRWAKEMEPAISAVAEALKKPLYVVPTAGNRELSRLLPDTMLAQLVDYNWPNTLPGIIAQRDLFQMFHNRFTVEAFQDNLESWENVLSMFRIARLFGKQPYSDAQNFVNPFESTASRCAIEFLKIETLETAKLLKCKADLDSLPERVKYEDTLEYSRFGWMKNISEFPQKGPIAFRHVLIEPNIPLLTEEKKKMIQQINAETENTIRMYREIPFDWNIVAEIMNAEFDEQQGKQTKQTLFQSNPKLRKIYDKTKVREHSLDEQLAIVKDIEAGELKKHIDEGWNTDRLRKMTLEERSIYLGKAAFAPYVSTPEIFSKQIEQGVAAFEEAKAAFVKQ